MNSQPPTFTSNYFADSAFEHGDFLTLTQAQAQFIPTQYMPTTFGTASASKIMITDASNSIASINALGTKTISQSNAAGGDFITLTSTATTARNTIKMITDTQTWEVGSRGSTATQANSFYIYNGGYRLTINSSGLVNIGNPTLGASSSLVNIGSTSYQLTLLNTSTYYTRLGTNAAGDLQIETNTAGGSGGITTSLWSPQNGGSIFLGQSTTRGTARLDFGATASNCIIKLFQSGSSGPTYMVGANNSAFLYTSGGANGHIFSQYTGSTAESLGTNILQLTTSAATYTSITNLTIPNSAWIGCATKPNLINLNSSGLVLIGKSTVNDSRNWLEVAAGTGNNSIQTDGYIAVGRFNALFPLHISSSNTGSYAGTYGFLNSAGAGTSGGGTGAAQFAIVCADRIGCQEVDCQSDRRLKTDIRPVSEEEALAFMSVEPSHFVWKKSGEHAFGYIAQDVLKAGGDKLTCEGKHLLDDVITQTQCDGLEESIDDDGFVSPAEINFNVGYSKCIPLLHKVVLMQQAQIERQGKLISELIDKVNLITLNISSDARGMLSDVGRSDSGGDDGVVHVSNEPNDPKEAVDQSAVLNDQKPKPQPKRRTKIIRL